MYNLVLGFVPLCKPLKGKVLGKSQLLKNIRQAVSSISGKGWQPETDTILSVHLSANSSILCPLFSVVLTYYTITSIY